MKKLLIYEIFFIVFLSRKTEGTPTDLAIVAVSTVCGDVLISLSNPSLHPEPAPFCAT